MSNNGQHPINAQSDLGHALLNEGKVSNKIGFGLTKREYFAAMAMQGLCANYLRENVIGWDIKTYAAESVALADGLLKALEE